MMNLNWIIELCAVFIAAECVQSQDPLIHVRPLCRSNMEVTCNASSGLYGMWTFYRSRTGSEVMENMGKVVDNERECHVTTLKTTQCTCIDANHIMCNIFDDMIAKPGDRWQCARHVNGSSLVSISDMIPNEEIIDCITTTNLENVTYETLTLSSMLTSVHTDSVAVTLPAEAHTSRSGESNVTEAEMWSSTTMKGNTTIASDSRESDGVHVNLLSNREFIIIMTAAGVTVFIATNVSFCVYWKFKTQSREISRYVWNDTISSRHNTETMSNSSDIYQDEEVNYDEISEIQTQFAGVSTILQTINTLTANYADTFVDNDESSHLSSAMEHVSQITRDTETNIPMPETMYLTATHRPMSFIALAEINMDDGSNVTEAEMWRSTTMKGNTTIASDSRESDGVHVNPAAIDSFNYRSDVQSVRYEQLDPSKRDDKSQYNTLV